MIVKISLISVHIVCKKEIADICLIEIIENCCEALKKIVKKRCKVTFLTKHFLISSILDEESTLINFGFLNQGNLQNPAS